MKGLLKEAGLEETKICTSTKIVKGCGKEKPVSDFPKTKNAHQAACKECLSVLRKNQYEIKKEEKLNINNVITMAWR